MITILATVITLIILVMTFWFILRFTGRLAQPRPQEPAATAVTAPMK